MPGVIEARGLTKRFGATIAVDRVDLDVQRGEMFAVVGPNGAGKTTLLRLLACLLEPTAGVATVLGHAVTDDAPALRQRFGYVSQEFTLYGTLSVEENLEFFADLYGVAGPARDARKTELLGWSRLAPYRDRRAGKLSGGMQKKLHLCCTLIHAPEVLLLDEPTAGVDPVSRRELWEILHDLVGRGLTLVVATPYMDEAEQCRRVALMDRGRILRSDTPGGLKRGIAERVWEVRAADLADVHRRLGRERPDVRSHLMGDRVHVLAPAGADTDVQLRKLLAGAPGPPASVSSVSPTMEDVFVSIVSASDRDDPRYTRAPVIPAREARRDGATAVRLEALTKRFGDFVAVDHVSLAVERGEVFGFLGPNGSGKTTTIRMLCGVLPPSEGTGQVLGHDIGRQSRDVRSRIGYMSQRFSLYNDLTVEENLAFFGRGYGLSPPRLAERRAWVAQMAGLVGDERRPARTLSGGVKQRLALGCAVLHEPDVLFLDEPTAGVDPLARREFWDVIAALAAAGTTVFVTTHYLDEAENCHRLGLMYQGRLVAIGTPQGLKEGMRAGVMMELDCREPFQALRLLRGVRGLGRASLFGDRLHVLVADAAAAEPVMRSAIEAGGLGIGRLAQIPLSLEDLFVTFIEMEEQGLRERRD